MLFFQFIKSTYYWKIDCKYIEKEFKSNELFVICHIKCKLHKGLNTTKGTVFVLYWNEIPEEEIIKELAAQSIIQVYKFQTF